MTAMMETISIGPRFFQSERDRLYSNWPLRFWGENFQNSIDAGAKKIKIEIKEEDGVVPIFFTDNGHGMSLDVLRNVFFRLGETTKEGDPNTIGGFGRARILTCFSMESYEIRTNGNFVKGKGSSFSIEEMEHFTGCSLTIRVPGISKEMMTNALHQYLGLSQLNCEVTINGVAWKDWLYKNRLVREFSWGKVYANKSSGLMGTVVVRSSGAMMFTHHTNAKAQIVVEINPEISREVLVGTRDSLHDRYRHELEAFLQEISQETNSGLKYRPKRKTTRFMGKLGTLKVKRKEAYKPVEHASKDVAMKENPDVVRFMAREASVAHAGINRFTQVESSHVRLNDASIEPEENKAFFQNLFDVYVSDDAEGAKVRKQIDNFNPKNWVWTQAHGKLYRKGADYLKLLLLWKVACECALEAALLTRPEKSVEFIVGWVFEDAGEDGACEARHGKIDDVHVYMLNPLGANASLNYKTTDKMDRKRLMALAKHEVAHTFVNCHNEEYAGVLTDIDAKFDERQAWKAMDAALAAFRD